MNLNQIREMAEIKEFEVEDARKLGLVVIHDTDIDEDGSPVERWFATHKHFAVNFVGNGGLWGCMS